MKNFDIKKFLKENTILAVLIVVYLFFIITTRGLIFSSDNFEALISQNAYVFVLGIGMLMCMLTGGNIDLSCGSFVCFIGAVGGLMMVAKGMSASLSITVLILIGLAYGAILGFAIAFLNIPPWIATLAGYLAFRGLGTEILSTSTTNSFTMFPEGFLKLFAGKLFKTPYGEMNIPCVIICVVLAAAVVTLNIVRRNKAIRKGVETDSALVTAIKSAAEAGVIILFGIKLSFAGGFLTVLVWIIALILIYNFVTEKTVIGRYFLTVGGNKEASRLSGVNTKLVMFGAYMNMAFLTVIASFMTVARYEASNAQAGTNFEMDAISACVVGGVSAYGGSGTVFGMVIGATLIGVINLGMNLMNIDQNWQKVVKGLVLLAAVVFDIFSKREARRAAK